MRVTGGIRPSREKRIRVASVGRRCLGHKGLGIRLLKENVT